MMTTIPKLELRDVNMAYGKGKHKVQVLTDLSITVADGEFVSIIGPSGSGKSTLFYLIGGVEQPQSGQILVDGHEINGKSGYISYMPQSNTLFPWRKVIDNMSLGQEIAGGDRKETRVEALAWLERMGLAEYAEAYPDVLSGGMQQRIAFVRALLSPQTVMCLDEPFGALDAMTRQDMQYWLLSIWEENRKSVLFITHSIDEAILLSDRIYVLSNKPTSVLREVQVPFDRPRRQELVWETQFIALRREIYELMKTSN